MKKIISLIAAAAFVMLSPYVKAQSATPSDVKPNTVITVTITEKRDVVKAGPYARFSQMYMGAAAPLSNKETFSIKSAEITYSTDINMGAKETLSSFSGTPEMVVKSSNIASDTSFVRVTPDRTSSSGNLEEFAAAAAERLYTLRKRRFDVLTSEAGENVYGAGLGPAINEMKRMEEEYVSLFMGKTFKEIKTKTYKVVPKQGAQNVIVCRFTENTGLLPSSNLAGRPIVIELTTETAPQAEEPAKGGKGTGASQHIPAMVSCRIKDGNRIIAEDLIPIYQLAPAEDGAPKK